MRRIAYAAVMLMGVLTIAGCARVDELFTGKTEKITFVASFADETRTSYQGGGKVDWVEGDSIWYYTKKGGTVGEYEVARSGHSTNVVADVTSGTSYIIAAYGGTDITDNTVTSFTLNGAVKSEQTGKFEDAHVSVAKGFDIEDGASLAFHNMTSIIKFTLERTDVSYITFTANGGEKIHGSGILKVTFNDDVPSVAFGSEGDSTIRVNTNGAGTFYLSTLPGDLPNGFTVKYYDSGMIIGKTVYNKLASIQSGCMLNLGVLDSRIEAIEDFSQPIDMGLSVMWSSCNLGASKPEDYGDYYAWGEIEPKSEYSWNNYIWCNQSRTSLTKYNLNSSYGEIDNKFLLEYSDDAAYVRLRGLWRIPTNEEWAELRNTDNCTWTKTKLNGKNGFIVNSKKTGNSIFLPAAGYRYDKTISYLGSECFYWSSSLSTDKSYNAWHISSSSSTNVSYRSYGQSIRPVYDDIHVTSLTIDKAISIIGLGEAEILSAIALPSNTPYEKIKWTSGNEAIVTVDQNGKVVGLMAGTATITAKTIDGNKVATCKVIVREVKAPTGAVDMGLSVFWATCNLGAATPEGYGDYYAWGATEPLYEDGSAQLRSPIWKSGKSLGYSWANCPFRTSGDNKDNVKFSKYVPNNKTSYWGGSGTPDDKMVLDMADDAAYVKLGGKWRIPTDEEWTELRNADNCTWIWTTQNGINGYKVTSIITGNSIFLPAAGRRDDTSLVYLDSYGHYGSSSLEASKPYNAWRIYFYSLGVFRNEYGGPRYYGRSIRPVSD